MVTLIFGIISQVWRCASPWSGAQGREGWESEGGAWVQRDWAKTDPKALFLVFHFSPNSSFTHKPILCPNLLKFEFLTPCFITLWSLTPWHFQTFCSNVFPARTTSNHHPKYPLIGLPQSWGPARYLQKSQSPLSHRKTCQFTRKSSEPINIFGRRGHHCPPWLVLFHS